MTSLCESVATASSSMDVNTPTQKTNAAIELFQTPNVTRSDNKTKPSEGSNAFAIPTSSTVQPRKRASNAPLLDDPKRSQGTLSEDSYDSDASATELETTQESSCGSITGQKPVSLTDTEAKR